MDVEVFGHWTGIQREVPVLWWWWEGETAGKERQGLKRMRGRRVTKMETLTRGHGGEPSASVSFCCVTNYPTA